MIGYALLLNLEGIKITTCHLYFARHGYQYSANFEELMEKGMSEAVKEFKKLTDFDRNLGKAPRNSKIGAVLNTTTFNSYWARRVKNQCIGKNKDGRRCSQIRKKGQETCYLHDTKSNRQCSGKTKLGKRCCYPAKKGEKFCHIHSPLTIQNMSVKEEKTLVTKMKQVPSIPINFWRKRRYGSTNYPTRKGWVSWCRKFSKQHPMWGQQHNSWGSQNDIALKLMKSCNIEKSTIISYLDSNKVDLKVLKSNWNRFWKVHEIIINNT